MQLINEGKAKIKIANDSKISRKLPVFYNPVMKLNRDITILLLNAVDKSDMQMALPLAGTGIRGIRFFLELNEEKIRALYLNDFKIEKVLDNLKLNEIDSDKIITSGKDANMFLLENKGFDYIDIDPFGSPNPFLENSIVRLARDGILAVTATDTAALSGSSKDACQRKYWAKPLRNELMHELGIRILIRKVQLIGAQNDKALIPIFSYSKDHYFKIFFRCSKGKKKVDELFNRHNYLLYNNTTCEMHIIRDILDIKAGNTLEISSENALENKFDYAGPLWTGKLWDEKLVKKMKGLVDKEQNEIYDKKLRDLIDVIAEESKIDCVGFYDPHKLVKLRKIKMPKTSDLLGKEVVRTHFVPWAVKSKLSVDEVFKIK